MDMAESEMLDIVDMDDNVIGASTKESKMANGLVSRNVAIFIRDGQRILIARRAMHKKTFPGRYDLAVCGNVAAGESYEDAARRELMEELGIGCRLTMLKKVFNEINADGIALKYFTGIFIGDFSGDVKLNDELSETRWLSVPELEEMMSKGKDAFCPFFVKDFLYVRDMLA
jgi:isopentenyl-diphosphate delta-isomerase type 1